jgi:hypothetical protein
MSLLSLLSQTCTIKRPSTVNTNGIITTTYATAATGVRVLVQEKAGQVEGTAAGQVLKYDARGFFLPSADVRPGAEDSANPDQIELTGPASASGQKWSVLLVTDEAGKYRLRTAYLRRHHAG